MGCDWTLNGQGGSQVGVGFHYSTEVMNHGQGGPENRVHSPLIWTRSCPTERGGLFRGRLMSPSTPADDLALSGLTRSSWNPQEVGGSLDLILCCWKPRCCGADAA